MITDKKIVITGGGGFIGTNLAKRLADHNQIVLLDVDFDKNSFAFSDLKTHRNVQTVRADVLDISGVERVISGAQIVIHMAAMVGVQEVLSDSLYTLDVNYIGTSNLLKILSRSQKCERAKIGRAHV